MLAVIRPDSWNLPLFLHVLGAIALTGGTGAVAIAGFAGRRSPAHARLLSRVVLRTWLLVVVPAWVLMRVDALLILDKEFPGDAKEPGWVGVGFVVSEAGAVLLLVLGALAWLWARRDGAGRAGGAVPWLATIYVLALGVAMFAMSGKPGA
ncbi:MAG TPA: hypothetical protein VE753_08820 [Gaiellaceae bacterium]|jgi:hypothetical protein|nr:hypothetical protein [Gaiellaceae bacterium]